MFWSEVFKVVQPRLPRGWIAGIAVGTLVLSGWAADGTLLRLPFEAGGDAAAKVFGSATFDGTLSLKNGRVAFDVTDCGFDARLADFTIEFFIRGKAAEIANWSRLVSFEVAEPSALSLNSAFGGPFAFLLQLDKDDGRGNLFARIDPVDNGSPRGMWRVSGFDDRWHHVALTVTRGRKAEFFFDYESQGFQTLGTAAGGRAPSGDRRFWLVLGNGKSSFGLDEFRISRGALSERQFLRPPHETRTPVRLARPFGDHMVLQRDRPVPVWGTAGARARVRVTFAGQTCDTVADADGRWRVTLAPLAASKVGHPLSVVSLDDQTVGQAESHTISDVLVGEVWIVSGQSNCEMPLVGTSPHFGDRSGILVANMTHRPYIRFAHASTYCYSLEPRQDLRRRAQWKALDPKSLREGRNFSALGIYFALDVQPEIDVPVGLIGVYWGATRIEAWIPREGLKGVKGSEWCFAEPTFEAMDWQKSRFGGRLEWYHSQPSVLWNDMVAPWCPMSVRGVLWYQGCSNSNHSGTDSNDNYRLLMHALYDSWSQRLENPGLKLYFVQLAPHLNWWDIQLAQARFAAEEGNAAMVTACDVGNLSDIHPNEKGVLGRRLAALALRYDYDFRELVADAPRVATCTAVSNVVELTCRDASSWWLYNPDWSVAVPFELAGADGVWKPARLVNTVNGHSRTVPWRTKGCIDGGAELRLVADGVERPVRVRHLYRRPWAGSLYSVDSGLPLGPFEVDVIKEEGR